MRASSGKPRGEGVEDVVLNPRPDATERMIEIAGTLKAGGKKEEQSLEWRAGSVQQRLAHALVHGITQWIVEDTEEARQELLASGGRPIQGAQLAAVLSLVPDLDSLRLVRLLGLVGVVLLGILLYHVLRTRDVGRWFATGLAVSVIPVS